MGGWRGLALLVLVVPLAAWAQEAPMPLPAPAGAAAAPVPQAAGDAPLSPANRLRELEENLREMARREAENRRLADEHYEALKRQVEELRRQQETPEKPAQGKAEGGESGAGQRGEEGELPAAGEGSEGREEGFLLRGRLEDGFGLATADGEYSLRLHVLDQTDFKNFVPGDQQPARSGLYIPRVRVYFEGCLTKPFQYEVSIQRSVDGAFDILDANLNIAFARELQLRFGRTLVPYSYDWYDHLEQYFITPERALFPLNFGLARAAGLLVHGTLGDGVLQYAAGGFDGHLSGVADNNTTRDAVGYVNARPFLHGDSDLLRYVNVGCSGFLGKTVEPTTGVPIRTSVQASENDEAAQRASSIILEMKDDTFAFGHRAAGAIHLAWYYQALSLEAEYQRGWVQFTRTEGGETVDPIVPVGGFHVTTGLFVTGETVTRRAVVMPRRPWDPLHRQWGWGAVELFARYSRLHIGEEIFTEGLADPDKWTNRAGMTDVGWNWYMNQYVKWYFDWQHVHYGSPVLLNEGKDLYSRHNDLFWIRCQVWF